MRYPRLLTLLLTCLLAFCLGCDDSGGDNNEEKDQQTETDLDAADLEVDEIEQETAEEMDTEPEVVETVSPLEGELRVVLAYEDENSSEDVKLYLIEKYPDLFGMGIDDLTPITAGIDCSQGTCYVDPTFDKFFFHSGDGVLFGSTIGDDQRVTSADLIEIDTEVSEFHLADQRAAFVADNNVFYMDLSQGMNPHELTELIYDLEDGFYYSGGGIAIGERGEVLLLYRYDLSTLAVFSVDLDSGEELLLTRYGVPLAGGSYFTGENPIAVTQDGNTAIVLIRGLALYDTTCQNNVDCAAIPDSSCHFYTNDAGVISATGLCGANHTTLQSFGLDTNDLLGECDSDDDCDPRHRCSIEPTTMIYGNPEKICVPKQLYISPRGGDRCTLIQENQFADILIKLRMTQDDQVVFLGRNDCGALNISHDSLVSVDASLDPTTFELIEGDYQHDYGAQFCYNESEDRWDFPSCAIQIEDFELLPGGGGVILGSGYTSNDIKGREVWGYDDEGNKFPMTQSVFYNVRSFGVIQ